MYKSNNFNVDYFYTKVTNIFLQIKITKLVMKYIFISNLFSHVINIDIFSYIKM
jgi:hypothetical protein